MSGKPIVIFVMGALLAGMAAPAWAEPAAPLILLEGWPETGAAADKMAPMRPYSLEVQAHVIALGVIGRPRRQRGKQLVELTLGEILKGEPAIRKLFPEDTQPFFGCIMPRKLPRPSEQLPPGTPVIVYLTHGGEGLRILLIGKRPEPLHLERIREFLRIHAAVHADSPPWDTLLFHAAWGPDDLTFYALAYYGMPAAREAAKPALLGQLSFLLGALEDDHEPQRRTHVDWQRVRHLLGLLQMTQPDPVVMDRLTQFIEWEVASHISGERGAGGELWIPDSTYLQTADAATTKRLLAAFRRMLEWMRNHASTRLINYNVYSATPTYLYLMHALASLPGEEGVRVVLGELPSGRFAPVVALGTWASRRPRGAGGPLLDEVKAAALKQLAATPCDGTADERTLCNYLKILLTSIELAEQVIILN